jgi:hypothetical protein
MINNAHFKKVLRTHLGKSQKAKNGKAPLYARVTADQKRASIASEKVEREKGV